MKIPPRLQKGDLIRVIAPSRSFRILSEEVVQIATSRLNALGLKVSFGRHCQEIDSFLSSSVGARLTDLHEAFADQEVKGILTAIGGYNANQLLSQLDYELIAKYPKILCGYSDITTLQNAIFSQTGLVTYSGPHFSTLGCLRGIEYSLASFREALFHSSPTTPIPSTTWSDDEQWYMNQNDRTFMPNEGWKIFHEGEVEGVLCGGNLSSWNLLLGTFYQPSLEGSILFLEEDSSTTPELFDRNLQSLLLQRDFPLVRGIVFGRFQVKSKITEGIMQKILSTKTQLKNIPIVSQVDFGHTMPMFTFPIGGKVKLSLSEQKSKIVFSL